MRAQILTLGCLVASGSLLLIGGTAWAATPPPISEDTEECLECHRDETPGIVEDWLRSRHAQFTVEQALALPEKNRRVSAAQVPAKLLKVVVGCAECHKLNPKTHKDTFDHEGHDIHTVVSPPDCATCHPVEVKEYADNIMSQAYDNLVKNPAYHDLATQIAAPHELVGTKLKVGKLDDETFADACLSCHGTKVEVVGTEERGGMTFPKLKGWPNQGVGRINPDGSEGSCSACHARHQFSIEVARKPATCGQCHKGPDVPAYKIYMVSKHGNLYSSLGDKWTWDSVPWVLGKDFTAPTCATCHMSGVVAPDGTPIAKRSHAMSDRLPWRLFGLPYAHAHPKSPDTTIIRNKDGLPLPTALDGTPAAEFLIDKAEQTKREDTMKRVCNGCHSSSWTNGHFDKLHHTIEATNKLTATATGLLVKAYENKLAKGLAEKSSLFDEPIERLWMESWLFYANSIRMAAAMGGADYGVFAGGRWQLARTLREMEEWLQDRLAAKKKRR